MSNYTASLAQAISLFTEYIAALISSIYRLCAIYMDIIIRKKNSTLYIAYS